MINKKAIALLLSATMALSVNVPVLADNEVVAVDAEDSFYGETLDPEALTGSCKMHFSLDARGDYNKTGKKSAYVSYADGSYGTVDVDYTFSGNSLLSRLEYNDLDASYYIEQVDGYNSEKKYYISSPALIGVERDGWNYRVGDYELRGWYNKKFIEGTGVNSILDVIYFTTNLEGGGSASTYSPEDKREIDFSALGQQDYYLVTKPIARYSANFALYSEDAEEMDYEDLNNGIPVYVDNGDGTYSAKQVKICFKGETFSIENEWDKNVTTDKTTEFKLNVPEVVADGYEVEKWVLNSYYVSGNEALKEISAKDSLALSATDETKYLTYHCVLKPVSASAQSSNDKIVEKTVSTNAGNHTIALKMNEAPAYTGGKLRATDFISSFKIDGKEYPAKDIKIKVEGDKKVGSKVKVTIKKIKGADKQTNKDVKGTVLGEVTIRPIDVSEVTTWNKTFTKEGQIVVKTNKNGEVKSVAAVVSKKGVNSGDNKAKKLKVKKGTYTYDSAKKTITFNDGAICKGTVSLNAAK